MVLLQLIYWLNGTHSGPGSDSQHQNWHEMLAKRAPNFAMLKFRGKLIVFVQGLFFVQVVATYVFNIEIVKFYYQQSESEEATSSRSELGTWLRLFGITFATQNAEMNTISHIIVMSAIICVSSTYKVAS